MTADEEDNYIVAQANEPLDRGRTLRPEERVPVVTVRRSQEYERKMFDYMDVSPKMVVLRGNGHDSVPGER